MNVETDWEQEPYRTSKGNHPVGRWVADEFGEKAEQAAIREVKEETGLDITPIFVHYLDEIYPEINWHSEVFFFHSLARGKEESNEEVTEMRWFDPNEAENMDLAFGHQDIIRYWREKWQKR